MEKDWLRVFPGRVSRKGEEAVVGWGDLACMECFNFWLY